ncbi:MAG: antiterminator LoaP [Termitinemataceae bacterium]|nr:MAG: antiterminator LoaP [Termitinemataceae bacterium]
MKYYIAQVLTGEERKYITLVKAMHKLSNIKIYFPTKIVKERQREKILTKEKPLFKGYIIIELQDNDDIKHYIKSFRTTTGFVRFLKNNTDVTELSTHDREIIKNIIQQKEIGISKVTFDENDKIVVLSGVMKGMEGSIVKVNKRKRRAQIKLLLCEETFTIDLSFEVIQNA